MTHCSLVSMVRLVQVHLELVPLKPSSGPPHPPPFPSLCVQLSFTSTLPQRQRVTTKFHPGYARQRTILQTTLQNLNLQRLQLLYFLFPSLCVLPPQSWTIINILGNSYQGSTHPLCSGPWPSCCRPRFAQRQSCPDGRSGQMELLSKSLNCREMKQSRRRSGEKSKSCSSKKSEVASVYNCTWP